jgi:hypothetical protein
MDTSWGRLSFLAISLLSSAGLIDKILLERQKRYIHSLIYTTLVGWWVKLDDIPVPHIPGLLASFYNRLIRQASSYLLGKSPSLTVVAILFFSWYLTTLEACSSYYVAGVEYSFPYDLPFLTTYGVNLFFDIGTYLLAVSTLREMATSSTWRIMRLSFYGLLCSIIFGCITLAALKCCDDQILQHDLPFTDEARNSSLHPLYTKLVEAKKIQPVADPKEYFLSTGFPFGEKLAWSADYLVNALCGYDTSVKVRGVLTIVTDDTITEVKTTVYNVFQAETFYYAATALLPITLFFLSIGVVGVAKGIVELSRFFTLHFLELFCEKYLPDNPARYMPFTLLALIFSALVAILKGTTHLLISP